MPEPGSAVLEDWYRQIYESVALPVLMFDAQSHRIVAVNQAAVAQYGYSREEFIGLSVLEVRPPEDHAEARKVLAAMPHGFWKASAVRHRRKDGSVFRVDVWSRDTIVGGRPMRVSTISDVNERVQLEHELRHAQKMEAVGRLAGGVAHDFNNVLTSIIGYSELLLERLGHDAPAAADVQEIRRAADRAAALTHQLLAFSRQQVMRIEIVPLDDVVERVRMLLRRVIGEDIELQTELAPATWAVRVDPGQLEQVIMNLAVNARDAMPDGGTLLLATQNVSLPEDALADALTIPAGDYAELLVRDTGIGMDAITRARVFEPFFTTKPAPEGTGLGLSMVYGIIRQSNGFITVESAPGSGTTFRILLPRAGRATPLSTAPVSAPSGDGHRTVLVVEDEDAVRRITCRVLERLGYTVIAAADGEAALAIAASRAPIIDLLVTDLVMPRMNGRELADQLAATFPGLRVLFVSGYTGEAIGRHGLLRPGTGFLQKPFSIESLSEAVKKVLHDPNP
ncbi:MAG: ATP-binding protein [Gemmatimonadaceae bacterium]